MNLQTKITVAAPDFLIDYNSRLMMLGSWGVSFHIINLTWM